VAPVNVSTTAFGVCSTLFGFTNYSGDISGLFDGPRLLLSDTQQQRLVIVVAVDVQGRPVLSNGKDGAYSVASIDRIEAGEKEIAEALRGGHRMRLAAWNRTARDAPAAFVFDAITVPESSELARPAAK
jgi:hypothetical protein